jgi:hypothetical protein
MRSRYAAYHIVPRQVKTTTAQKKMRKAPSVKSKGHVRGV